MSQRGRMQSTVDVCGVDVIDSDDVQALFVASGAGDVATVHALLERDPRLVNAQRSSQFPIHRAVAAGQTETVRILLNAGADPGQSRYSYDSWDKLLVSARRRESREIEGLLVQAMQQRFNYSPDFEQLRAAIISGESSRIEDVLQEHSHLVTASDMLGNNALHWCVLTRQLRLLAWFASMGTPIDGLRADGHSPILLAVSGATDYWYRETRSPSHPTLRNTFVLVGYLLALGADYTVSVAAAVGDQQRIEQLLQEAPGLAGRLDSARVSPLARASRAGHLHLVRLLLDHGADPNRPEECAPEGRALYEACCANHLPIARLLLERGANPNAGVDSCECCLTIAEVQHGEQARPLQELLISCGAILPPYRMTRAQLAEAIRSGSEATRHEEFLRCVMQNCDAELLELLLAADSTVIDRLESGDELTFLSDPALAATLLSRGLNPRRRNWTGRTLIEICQAGGQDLLAGILSSSEGDESRKPAAPDACP